MKNKLLHKVFSVVASLSLLANSFLVPVSVLAQEVVDNTTQEETQTPVPEPTVDATPIPLEELVPAPDDVEVTPIPTEELVLVDATVEADVSQSAAALEPEVIEDIPLLPESDIEAAEEESSAQLTPSVSTDKADYAPTETVVISGNDYPIYSDLAIRITWPDGVIRSSAGEIDATDTILTDEIGSFIALYDLRGEGQEGEYLVEILMGTAVLATTTFTDGPVAIWTTDVSCGGVNLNDYVNKTDVFLNGGPTGGGGGLPDGEYYIQVTQTNGLVLGTSGTTTVTVSGGTFASCYDLFTLTSFGNSVNGVYKVWASMNPGFPNSESKTDNFKVGDEDPGPDPDIPYYNGLNACPPGFVKGDQAVVSRTISSTDADGETFSLVIGGKYLFEASGTFIPTGAAGYLSDAGYTLINGVVSPLYGINAPPPGYGAHALLGNLGNGVGIVDWGDYNPNHSYAKYYEPTISDIQFVIGDRYGTWFNTEYDEQVGMSDNNGSLNLDVYECEPETGTIIVHKVTNPGEDQTEFGVTLFNVTGAIGIEETLTTSSPVIFEVEPGIYWVNETTVAGGWNETRNSCRGLGVRRGQTIECWIVNTKLGSISVDKVTDPEDSEQEFEFTLSREDRSVSVLLADGDDPHTFPNLPLGTYLLSEAGVQGWDLTSALCTNGEQRFDPRDGFELLPGGHIRCVFENTLKRGSIYGYKYEDGDGSLQTTGDWTPVEDWVMELWEKLGGNPFTFTGQTDTTDLNGLYFFTNLLPGVYGVKEQMQPGWTNLTNTKRGPINLEPGEREGEYNFVNARLSDVHGYKWNDRNGNGQKDEGEELLGGWSIGIFKYDGGGGWDTVGSMVTEESGGHHGWYWFEDLLPGTYKICERLKPDWTQTYPMGGRIPGCHLLTLPDNNPNGFDVQENRVDGPLYNFGNYEKGSITVIKNVDIDGDGNVDIFGTNRWTWTINGRGEFRTGDTHELPAGTYLIAENQVPGYYVTGLDCGGKKPLRPSESTKVLLDPGEHITCTLTNTREVFDISIDKSNDKSGGAAANDTVTYTLVTTNNGNQPIYDVIVTDALPGGFSYVAGSAEVDGALQEPTQSGGLLSWNVGTLGLEDPITIIYQATIASDIDQGVYTNLATCKGVGEREQIEQAFEWCNIADSSVPIGINFTYSDGLRGEVLGAATELPATGNDTKVLIMLLTVLALGASLKVVSYNMAEKKERKNA
jgi:uncharacterized repeat protein (TIGR01451 family)